MASQNPNPFTVGKPVPPEGFVGREDEIRIALDQILSRSNLAIWGGAGIGKSSFLKYLTDPEMWQLRGCDPSNAIIVYLNCELISKSFTPSNFWREILNRLQEKLSDDADLQSEIDTRLGQTEVTSEDLVKVLKKIGEQNKFLVLLLDDYDAILFRTKEQYADIEIFLSQCRSLVTHPEGQRSLSMIVASRRCLDEMGPKLSPDDISPWYNHYLFQPLKPFTEDEVKLMLSGMLMTPELREGIREIADGHPGLLQNAAHLWYSKVRYRQNLDLDTFAKEFWERTEPFFGDIWKLCNEVEQILLMLIALSRLKGRLQNKHYDIGDIRKVFSQKSRELSNLEERGVIISTVENKEKIYLFASSMMERWVIKEIENSDEEAIRQRQKVLKNTISTKQAETVKNVIQYLLGHKNDVKSLVKWIVKLAKIW